jgi:hypothetical protein
MGRASKKKVRRCAILPVRSFQCSATHISSPPTAREVNGAATLSPSAERLTSRALPKSTGCRQRRQHVGQDRLSAAMKPSPWHRGRHVRLEVAAHGLSEDSDVTVEQRLAYLAH